KQTSRWASKPTFASTNAAPRSSSNLVFDESGSCQTTRTKSRRFAAPAWRLSSAYRSKSNLTKQPLSTFAPKRKRWGIFWTESSPRLTTTTKPQSNLRKRNNSQTHPGRGSQVPPPHDPTHARRYSLGSDRPPAVTTRRASDRNPTCRQEDFVSTLNHPPSG